MSSATPECGNRSAQQRHALGIDDVYETMNSERKVQPKTTKTGVGMGKTVVYYD